MAEFFQSLPKKQHSVMWSSLLSLMKRSVGLGETAEGASASCNGKVCVIAVHNGAVWTWGEGKKSVLHLSMLPYLLQFKRH